MFIVNTEVNNFYSGKRILVTGHTGFTGGWLCVWLQSLNAEVFGFALEPKTTPNMFDVLKLDELMNHKIGNICDVEVLTNYVNEVKPDIIFHLAAQPIVSIGYDDPHDTFNTNVMGTLNVLEAARNSETVKAVVCVTTDKVYKNNEWHWGYREVDELGGSDPYSASKSASEMVITTYQKTLSQRGNNVLIASARGGNIIGGGDWAPNRIVPDFVLAAINNETLSLRSPTATRPWQHVMALVHGYLLLGYQLSQGEGDFAQAWNFGPLSDGEQSVGALVEEMKIHWPEVKIELGKSTFKESHFLHLTSEKARTVLGWKPPLNFAETIKTTADWYKEFYANKSNMLEVTKSQIAMYNNALG